MSNFTKSASRFLEDTNVIPTSFLSQEIKDWMIEELDFLPHNAYVGNAAGDYVFISVVRGTEVYTLTDCYNLDALMTDMRVR
jgi:hypothetical protein